MFKLAGIYRIVDTVSGEVYVGSSRNMLQRWGVHLTQLGEGWHRNSRLLAAWQRDGAAAFRFEIAEIVEDTDALELREHSHIRRVIAEVGKDKCLNKVGVTIAAWRLPA